MPLYSSFNTSQYYDDEPVVKKEKKPQVHKKPHQVSKSEPESLEKRSLYAESQTIASTKSEYGKVDFTSVYRVGQMVRIQERNGKTTTNKGRVVEIVSHDLMYVGMEDTHKDVNDNWLVEFVTKDHIITKL